ncbi:hypothetical protein CSQ85_00280 [Bifidobacterium rousetti]|uniref:hypothetical protein n=1 Tax=Bifidobacterium rousetti TaxID=2045439 RepID=UPI00123B228A|nr:hypothetical protein [Bifidobacterium rousetti]KAA8820287.1 hypothetical protein CSQ85_00280 [Bifidobacterium rousetti]
MTRQNIKDLVVRWHARDAATPEETARLLNLPLAEVNAILAEAGRRHPSVRTTGPEFIEPELFQ